MKSPSQKRSTAADKKRSALERMSLFLQPGPSGSSAKWSAMQSEYMLEIFRTAASHVPAYRTFLKERGTLSRTVNSIADFKKVPPMSKDNYLRKSAWEDLILPGALAGKPLVLSATSGSTGKPFYFPRTGATDEQSYVYHRTFLENSGLNPKEPTLVIVAFGMGVWIGGIITYEAFKRISDRDFPLTILTPGVNKKEIFEALREIGPQYTQLILCGYPPFVKDVIDDGPENGVTWKHFDMRVVCAAEGFSEEFRDYLMRKTGMKNPHRDVMNIYGSAELGTMATETPLSILIRHLSIAHPALFPALFSDATRLPTLAQFVPSFVSFEAVDNRIYATAGSALPLVRFDIGDHGGVLTYSEVKRICAAEGIDLKAEIKKAGIADTVRELPFVYVYERADLSTKLYGAIIFPEHIRHGLHSAELEPFVTGKFTMFTKHAENQDEYLEVNVELKDSVDGTHEIIAQIGLAIKQSLMQKSTEYHYLVGAMKDRVNPRVITWAHNHAEHFAHGTKHKWVKKA
ncbi:hypothetical protein K8R03_04045 [Candidatus Kaiserbacteria bacterium]|nr:hypothetical protein [Candidatus Kaiserbacteria bacterium]